VKNIAMIKNDYNLDNLTINSQCFFEGLESDDQCGTNSGNVKRLQAIEGDTNNANSTLVDSESDDWMDEVIDVFTPVKLPMPSTKPKRPYFFQPVTCAKCGNVYKSKCYHCVVNYKEKTKHAMKKGCQDIVKKQYRPTYVKLGFQETVNSLRKKMAIILNQQRLKGNNVDVYWRIGTKQSTDLTWIAKQVVNGELAVACYRLNGGMKEEDFEIEEIVMDTTSQKIKKGKDLPYQQPPTTVINGLAVTGARNRDDRKIDYKEKKTKCFQSNIKRTIKRNLAQEERKDLVQIPGNGDFYVASMALYESDPSFRISKLSTKFEDQLQYCRHTLTQGLNQVVCVNPTVGNYTIPEPIPNQINLMTEWSEKIKYIWLAEPKEYDVHFDYACRVIDDSIIYSIPLGGTYVTIAYPNQLTPTGRNTLLFNQYKLKEGETLFEPEPLTIRAMIKSEMVTIVTQQYIVDYAVQWMGGKNITNFTIVSFLNEFTKWWPTTANRVFTRPEAGQVIAALFQAARYKQVNLFESIGMNFDVLNLQHDNTKLLVDLPKYNNLWSILKKIASWIVPSELLDIAKETMDNYKYTGTGLKIWEQVRHAFDSGVVFLFGGAGVPSMKAFNWMNDRAAVIIEELLKMIPGLGLLISVKEIIDDWRKGKLTVRMALGRIIFHNWHEILPFWAKLLTLPLRMLWHSVWNSKSKKFFGSVVEAPLMKMTYDKREPPITEFTVIHHKPTFPRFPESEKVEIPENMKKERFITNMLDDVVEDPRNPVFVSCTVASSNSAGVKNGNNFISAYLKRNIQDRPVKNLERQHVEKMYMIANFWKGKLDMQEVDTLEWINSKNHGAKKEMYRKAWEEFLKTGDIDYKATLNLKYDEIVMKHMMRTICAFDNSYVVNVAPTIASCSNALKKLFNGYNNLSKSDKYTFHICYATGMTSDELSKIIDDNNIQSEIPHFLLLVLGDDSALIRDDKVLCCDFSRYDSTQHSEQHEVFRRMFTTKENFDKIEMLRKCADAPTNMFNKDSQEKYVVPTNGLKTGCMETSVSNTTITAISYALGLHVAMITNKDPFDFIPSFLKDKCGFLPKASYQNLNTGFEFLKTIFILQSDRIVSLPLLSSMAKLGKFLKNPKLIVPFAKIKNNHQIAIDSIMMQLKGKGNLQNIPGFKRWYNKIERMSQPFLPELTLLSHQLKLTGFPVHEDTIAIAYQSRYGLEWQSVDSFFEQLSKLELEDYPVTYTSTVVQQAIDVDYGLDPSY
jgi:hypothetical protein